MAGQTEGFETIFISGIAVLGTFAAVAIPIAAKAIISNSYHRTTPEEREVSRFNINKIPHARCIGEAVMKVTFPDGHTDITPMPDCSSVIKDR